MKIGLLAVGLALAVSGCAHETISRQADDLADFPIFESKQKFLVNGFDTGVKQAISGRSGMHEVISDDLADQATVLVRSPDGAGQAEEATVGVYNIDRDEREVVIPRSCKKRAKPEKGKKGDGKCLEWKEEQRFIKYTVKETCKFSIPVDVVEVATGNVIFSGSKDGDASSSETKDKRPPEARGQRSVCLEARESAASRVASIWEPRKIQVEVKLASLKSNDELHKQVVRLVRQSADTDALRVMEEALKNKTVDAGDEAATEYNITQLYWLNRRYQECREHYKKAIVLNSEPMPVFLAKACAK